MTLSVVYVTILYFSFVGQFIVFAVYDCPESLFPDTTTVKHFQGKCYQFVNKEKYWTDARDYCWKYGGRLVMIDDKTKQDFINSALNSISAWSNNGVWIGLNDKGNEGVYKWVTDTEFAVTPLRDDSFTYWASGHPGSKSRDCVRMVRDDGWKWHDTYCSTLFYKYRFICEYNHVIPTTTPTVPPNPPPQEQPMVGQVLDTTTTQSKMETTKLNADQNLIAENEKSIKSYMAVNDAEMQQKEDEKRKQTNLIAIVTGVLGSVIFLLILLIIVIFQRCRSKKSNKERDLSVSVDNVTYDGDAAAPKIGLQTIVHTNRSRRGNTYTTQSYDNSDIDGGYLDPIKLGNGYMEPHKLKGIELKDTYLTTCDVKGLKPDLLQSVDNKTADVSEIQLNRRYSGYLPMTGSKEKLQESDTVQFPEGDYEPPTEPIYAEIPELKPFSGKEDTYNMSEV